ncbi:LytTR family DNA-binding domain-containing protein [Bifidobacterium crudilactis]|jgi:DNA-binding LytR/AlgR family response regulator|uniref:LytTR family DNA-binding domain-containing protein n=1 Tax=Bifidobacterium crudilactis TaxID=327277 RepID=UPI0023564BD8|nr:LytTR family DNA-binding domain-containing protein [Bifidobacterium crudilactis]MCI1867920.1 LytTR family transcriptional regulator [Bifidobacterium crudilactis]MDN5971663.1 LytTR family transcriptional regulator [Bifidobacterium crudilactis]MDN6001287.1 LytTR family transcriptional regulator [Bifidobacterium crudilactis]MDN6210012.1 LytTR family transcriptional regulator [Bifidobacterium crudilactis]MDN6424399.1 LytTR family transcriptional regulator [Bifidobacterium crudilactis]
MEIDYCQDSTADAPRVVVYARQRDAGINALLQRISLLDTRDMIQARSPDGAVILKVADIALFRSSDKQVFARFGGHDLVVRETLKMLDRNLPEHLFQRVSNSAIVNLRFLRRFDLHANGVVSATLRDETSVKVTGTYMNALRERLISS